VEKTEPVIIIFRVTGRFTCFMELQKFPFDEQRCVVELESCEYK